MNTTTKKTKKTTGVNNAMKTGKKAVKKKSFSDNFKKLQEVMTKLYEEGKVKVYDPVK